MITIAIIFIISSFLASTLVIAAGMLSSRMSQSEVMVEEYQTTVAPQTGSQFRSWTQPVELNA